MHCRFPVPLLPLVHFQTHNGRSRCPSPSFLRRVQAHNFLVMPMLPTSPSPSFFQMSSAFASVGSAQVPLVSHFLVFSSARRSHRSLPADTQRKPECQEKWILNGLASTIQLYSGLCGRSPAATPLFSSTCNVPSNLTHLRDLPSSNHVTTLEQ